MSQQIIKNFYRMLCYVFEGLKNKEFEECSFEEFENITDLYAELLAIAVSSQLKHGLFKEYVDVDEELSTLKGKVNINQTMINMTSRRNIIDCNYDVLTTNNIYNQILKTTLLGLVRNGNIRKATLIRLKRELFYFNEVNEISLDRVIWSKIRYSRANKTYEVIINMCYLLYNSLLQSKGGDSEALEIISEKYEHRIYEEFVYRYFKKHHQDKVITSKDIIKWDVDEETDIKLLPTMKTDMVLTPKDKKLKKKMIIDTKYYDKSVQVNYGIEKFHSDNMYQMTSYIMNFTEMYPNYIISGMLLYARTTKDLNFKGKILKHDFLVKTLDLDVDFSQVKEQLNEIVKDFLKEV